MTEDEAKTKWCPMVRLSDGMAPLSYNMRVEHNTLGQPYLPISQIAKCIGSECMMFRWLPDYEIYLKDRIAIVDEEDKALVALESWWWDGRYVKSDKGYLHRIIAETRYGRIADGLEVDHIDGDPLNNRSGNLRVCTHQQNTSNAKTRGGSSRYRGVFRSRSGRWVAQICKSGVRQCLGTFDSEEDAAAAWDGAAKTIHGDFARLNLTTIEDSGRIGYCGLAGKP